MRSRTGCLHGPVPYLKMNGYCILAYEWTNGLCFNLSLIHYETPYLSFYGGMGSVDVSVRSHLTVALLYERIVIECFFKIHFSKS